MGDQSGSTFTPFQEARDRTLYWTISFYIPAHKLGRKHPMPPADQETVRLRDAMEPMFNDIADRSRRGKIEDRVFAAAGPEQIVMEMPARITWTTEGCTFTVNVPNEQRQRHVNVRRVWYQYPNGALSWHLNFDYFYGEDLAAERPGTAPITYYFLSLLQKLAWPKEYRCGHQAMTIDDLIGIEVWRYHIPNAGGTGDWHKTGFSNFVQACFLQDAARLSQLYPDRVVTEFRGLLTETASIEVPGLLCHDTRSLIYIQDESFFNAIQPRDEGEPVRRAQLVRQEEFRLYPQLIKQAKARQQRTAVILDEDFWQGAWSQATDASASAEATPVKVTAAKRIAYLFLAGFNNNIIDFMNQDAAEVLDSLIPTYPESEDENEALLVFATQRSIIAYVRRSRSLEVGNDYIGTCPYGFMLHVLSIHNEALTREQEDATFAEIGNVKGMIAEQKYEKAEERINDVRVDAFDIYDQHRYANPFRYETERDLFDKLERLRGTSRRKKAYKAALKSLEEKIGDLARIRERDEAVHQARRDRGLALLFGLVGIAGVVQMFFDMDEYFHAEGLPHHWSLGIAYFAVPLLVSLATMLWFRAKGRR